MAEAIRLRSTRSSLLSATMRQPTITFNTASTPSVAPGKDRVREAIKRAAKKARRVFSAIRSSLPNCLAEKSFFHVIPYGLRPENVTRPMRFGVRPAVVATLQSLLFQQHSNTKRASQAAPQRTGARLALEL